MPDRRNKEGKQSCLGCPSTPAVGQHPHKDVILEPVVRGDVPRCQEVFDTIACLQFPDVSGLHAVEPLLSCLLVLTVVAKTCCYRTDFHQAPTNQVRHHLLLDDEVHVEELLGDVHPCEEFCCQHELRIGVYPND